MVECDELMRMMVRCAFLAAIGVSDGWCWLIMIDDSSEWLIVDIFVIATVNHH